MRTDDGIDPATRCAVTDISLFGVSFPDGVAKFLDLIFGRRPSRTLGITELQREQRFSRLLCTHHRIFRRRPGENQHGVEGLAAQRVVSSAE